MERFLDGRTTAAAAFALALVFAPALEFTVAMLGEAAPGLRLRLRARGATLAVWLLLVSASLMAIALLLLLSACLERLATWLTAGDPVLELAEALALELESDMICALKLL